MHLQDGYKLITAGQLTAGLWALNERQITFRAFRVYVASFELLARREAAARTNPQARTAPRFMRSELERLIKKHDEASVSRELNGLKKIGLLSFSESNIEAFPGKMTSESLFELLGGRGLNRLVPVPRQVLRFLASCTRPALAKTIVAYLLRGLSLANNGELRNKGTVKISWVCKLCKISERAARSARAELIRLGWITKDTGSFQRKLNRDGAYFVINTAWRRALKQIAPLGPKECTRSAPLKEKLETPYGSKNQKPAMRIQSGVCVADGEGREPTLRDIQPEDLRKPARLESLYRQAVKAGWIQNSEASIRNFACAALRANRNGGRIGAIFTGIVKRQLWHHITQEQEDRALSVLSRFRDANPNAFNLCRSPVLSDDAVSRGRTSGEGKLGLDTLQKKLMDRFSRQ